MYLLFNAVILHHHLDRQDKVILAAEKRVAIDTRGLFLSPYLSHHVHPLPNPPCLPSLQELRKIIFISINRNSPQQDLRGPCKAEADARLKVQPRNTEHVSQECII